MRRSRWLRAALLVAVLAGCAGPGKVQFERDQCLIDGRSVALAEVKAKQAQVSQRIQSRQPLFVLLTVLVVLLAGASHADKVMLLFSTRDAQTEGLGERIRLALDRYRQHPVRYFGIVLGSIGLLIVTGGFYIQLDVDKRASERALGMLQFCHLALSNIEAQKVLAEQRKNLDSIQSTAGHIRVLVDKLPPAEKQKAREIVAQMNQALSHQGKLVGQYLHRTDESSRALREQTQAMQKGLSHVEAGIKSLPRSIEGLGEMMGRLDRRVAQSDARLASLEEHLKTLAAKASAPCPATAPPPSKGGPANRTGVPPKGLPAKVEPVEPPPKAPEPPKAEPAPPPKSAPADGGAKS